MSLTSDLLDQAKHLANREPKRPKQASLSRAVSTAYYALFHMLTDTATTTFLRGVSDASLRPVLKRAFTHSEMSKAAKGFKSANPISVVSKALKTAIPKDLQAIAETFVDLQEMRH
jgi:hypothetical protein